MRPLDHESHFESLERQEHAARFGFWVFLSSELLLFAALFGLYAGLRAEAPHGFQEGVEHSKVVIGTINTAILLVGSYFVARAVHSNESDRERQAAIELGIAVLLGAAFLTLKIIEYNLHVDEGATPGGRSAFYDEHPDPGVAAFFTLYWLMTGLHAIHVFVGSVALSIFGIRCARKLEGPKHAYRLELAGLYWHFVDSVWIFLWPLFYLLRGGGS